MKAYLKFFMDKTIVFIHGMFQNERSWDKWVTYFEAKGYKCLAPAWPLHEGDPAWLRTNMPADLGMLSLQTVTDAMENVVSDLAEPPILIGHSVGGLIVQLLVAKGLAAAGVAIDSVAPNAMLAFDWGFMKNAALITNPLKGDEPFLQDLETFHAGFCNKMSMEETKVAFDATTTHDSRNVLRDCMGEAGRVDLEMPHVPLLFIGGEDDEIIPAKLNEKNAKSYTDGNSLKEFKEFSGRGHFICGQPGWEEVADYIAEWLEVQVAPNERSADLAQINR
jgi:pimeloyl-ACP methyl ester carboxylesterase